MKTITAVTAATVLAALAGCATTSSIVPIGKDTYAIATPAAMGYAWEDAQKADALQHAFDYCKNIGKKLVPINSVESSTGVPDGSGPLATNGIEFKFTCK